MSKNASNALSNSCSTNGLERPRYFPRQLITPTEMNLEQDYFRSRLRLHNRLLHGWGVVCGALVCPVPKSDGQLNEWEPWCVKITTGYLLGPYGDEILIDCERKVDLRNASVSDCAAADDETVDPWCSEVFVQREAGPLWVAVKYAETAARPVRSQPTGCGCDDSQCEYSRWRDGYEICILDHCPDSHQGPPPELEFEGPHPDCPACPEEPWVVLAQVDVDADGSILEIDNCSCRRLVVGLGAAWWRCEENGFLDRRVRIDAVETEDRLVPGSTTAVIVHGRNLEAARSVTFADGVSAQIKTADRSRMLLEVSVSSSAAPGPRRMSVRGAEGRFITTFDNAVTIEAAATPPAKRAAKKAAKKAAKARARKKPAKKG